MALLGFKQRFVPRIDEGTKRQTIRKKRKHPIKPGETLYLYTGLRTKGATRIATVKCTELWWVVIVYNRAVTSVTVYSKQGGKLIERYQSLKELDAFAKLDGFDSWSDMRDFWIEEHHGSIFRGILIAW